jgi:hypothetical protein
LVFIGATVGLVALLGELHTLTERPSTIVGLALSDLFVLVLVAALLFLRRF